MTMRSKGSSKIIGAAIVPTMALPTLTQNPASRFRYQITMKEITAEIAVNLVIGSAGPTTLGSCCTSASTKATRATRNTTTASDQAVTIAAATNLSGPLGATGCRRRHAAAMTSSAATTSRTDSAMEPLPV